MELTFLNVDQLIEMSRLGFDHLPRFLLNLNAGNRFLGNLVIAPALAGWRKRTIAFCDARTALLSEDKPVSKLLAKEAGFDLPKGPNELNIGDAALFKPTNLGSSVGVYLDKFDGSVPHDYMVEEFIRGYDGTLVLVPSCQSGALEMIAAQIVVPDVETPLDWIYSEVAKEETDAAPAMDFIDIDYDTHVAKAAEALASETGCTSVARVDFRYEGPLEEDLILSKSKIKFVELNALPTMGRKNNVTNYTREYLTGQQDNLAASYLLQRTMDHTLAAAMYLLGSSLFKNQFQTK
ncbi:hypothetical protein [Tateyamaria sp. SN3-11]|uniref:hypothetical protein n=1 Tax=Tateyamaria sp. SN3-11 TaxID=3092147 RepID=UPI0039E86039